MKLLLIALMLASSTAFAYCPYDQNYNNCVQLEQMQKQLQQQQQLNQMNYHQSQQPSNIRQQCYQNVFGVIECR